EERGAAAIPGGADFVRLAAVHKGTQDRTAHDWDSFASPRPNLYLCGRRRQKFKAIFPDKACPLRTRVWRCPAYLRDYMPLRPCGRTPTFVRGYLPHILAYNVRGARRCRGRGSP